LLANRLIDVFLRGGLVLQTKVVPAVFNLRDWLAIFEEREAGIYWRAGTLHACRCCAAAAMTSSSEGRKLVDILGKVAALSMRNECAADADLELILQTESF
jgi:hypothetical protein